MENLLPQEAIEPLDEAGKWHARPVTYYRSTWDRLSKLIPNFETAEFRTSNQTPSNPYLKTVVRLPRTKAEQPIPVGIVSNTYSLAQHQDVASRCFEGIRLAGIDAAPLTCELGLTELGEWMNLRVYFPERFRFAPRKDDFLDLRLECFNSVDGSSRLVVLFGWLRFVCANGLVIGETRVELKDTHDRHLDIGRIPKLVHDAMGLVKTDISRLQRWADTSRPAKAFEPWVNKSLAETWGKKAASRVFHICLSGWDSEYQDPFSKGDPTEKPVRPTEIVRGAQTPAKSLYDVSQLMSWVATRRNDTEERLNWQGDITSLLEKLADAARSN